MTASACRSSLEARQHLPTVHARLDELDRHAPPNGLQLLGNPDRSHSSFADLFEQPVAVRDDLAGSGGCWPDDGRLPFARKVQSPDVGQFAGLVMRLQQRLDSRSQLVVARALRV